MATADEMRGKVAVLFSRDGVDAVGRSGAARRGILEFQKVGEAGGYDPAFNGIQYFGKGGAKALAVWRTDQAKLKENRSKQKKLMQQGAVTDRRIMSMMYWTTTGARSSIKKRNDVLWNSKNAEGMIDLWAARLPRNADPAALSSAPLLKSFMPNFVMIDFSSPEKCERIFWPNRLANSLGAVAVGMTDDDA